MLRFQLISPQNVETFPFLIPYFRKKKKKRSVLYTPFRRWTELPKPKLSAPPSGLHLFSSVFPVLPFLLLFHIFCPLAANRKNGLIWRFLSVLASERKYLHHCSIPQNNQITWESPYIFIFWDTNHPVYHIVMNHAFQVESIVTYHLISGKKCIP